MRKAGSQKTSVTADEVQSVFLAHSRLALICQVSLEIIVRFERLCLHLVLFGLWQYCITKRHSSSVSLTLVLLFASLSSASTAPSSALLI